MKLVAQITALLLLLSAAVVAQVPVQGPGNTTLQQLEGSPTLVTIVLKGEREVTDPNLRVKRILTNSLIVQSTTGEEHTYLFDSIAAVRVQGDVVEKATVRLPLAGALRSEDQQVVSRAAGRARDLFEQTMDNQLVKMDAAVLVHLYEGSDGADALAYLTQLVETNDLQTQLEAAQRLYLAGEEFPDQILSSGLSSGNRKVRIMAIELAGLSGYQEGSPMLMQALNDRSEELSAPAAIALARLGNREIIPRLSNMLTEPSEGKGKAAVEALSQLGGPDIIEQMRMMLPNAQLQGRFRIIQVLFNLGDPNGRRLLQETMENVPTLALEAAVPLAEVKDEQAMAYLRRRLAQRDDPTENNLINRARMAAALMSGNDPNAIGQFQELLRGELNTVKILVCELILELGDRRLLVILQPILESADVEVSKHAAMAAIGFGYPQFRERLLSLRIND